MLGVGGMIRKKESKIIIKDLNVTKESKDSLTDKEALREQALAMLMADLGRSEDRANQEIWLDAEDLEKELEV